MEHELVKTSIYISIILAAHLSFAAGCENHKADGQGAGSQSSAPDPILPSQVPVEVHSDKPAFVRRSPQARQFFDRVVSAEYRDKVMGLESSVSLGMSVGDVHDLFVEYSAEPGYALVGSGGFFYGSASWDSQFALLVEFSQEGLVSALPRLYDSNSYTAVDYHPNIQWP